MADELDGVIAFTEVLDRLVDAEKRAAVFTHEINDLRSRLQGKENDRARVQRERDQLQVERNGNLPKLAALWQAADTLLLTLSTSTADTTALRKALDNANDACDQIPF
jgi:chromosome segregation ATPase